MESVLDYTARFDASACGKEIDFVLTVKAPVTTLCPCSKAISAYGAHNQRGEVTVQIRSSKSIWIEDLIAIIESSASSELFSLLKREDEKAVTERAYENPVFVEDLVRNVVLKLNAHPDITWYKVEAENYESIHNHNAYASIEKGEFFCILLWHFWFPLLHSPTREWAKQSSSPETRSDFSNCQLTISCDYEQKNCKKKSAAGDQKSGRDFGQHPWPWPVEDGQIQRSQPCENQAGVG